MVLREKVQVMVLLCDTGRMTIWTPPERADEGAPLIPAPGPKALTALPSTGRMPILQGLVLFFGMVAAQIVTTTISDALAIPFTATTVFIIRALVTIALAVGVYLLALRVIGRRPASDFERLNWWRELLTGLVLGALLMSAVVASAWLAGAYRVEGINPNALVGTAAADSLLAGVTEEIIFRAGLLRLIEHRLGSWWALGLTSALFGAAHLMNPQAEWWGGLAIALEAGVLLGASYIVTRRLWMVIGLHASWNFVQGGIFSSDVSGNGLENTGLLSARIEGPWWLTGGEMGFEGAISAVFFCAGLGVFLLLVAKRRGLIIPARAFRFEAIGPCGPVNIDEDGATPPSCSL